MNTGNAVTGKVRESCIIQSEVNQKLTMKHTAINYKTYGNQLSNIRQSTMKHTAINYETYKIEMYVPS
jgi:hypothetical protein